MGFQPKNPELSYDARSNFGKKGWWIIVFTAMNWFMFSTLNIIPMNLIVPERAAQLGVDPGALLSFNTPGGYVSLVFIFFLGKIAKAKGVKLTSGVNLILAAIAVVFWGAAGTVAGYIVALFMVLCFTGGMELTTNMMVTNWFPRKKGIAIGWSTMGLNVSSATAAAIYVGIAARNQGNFSVGLYIMAGVTIALAIVTFTAFRNYPEEWGVYPDNDPNSPKRDYMKPRTGWTSLSVLKQKETWKLGFGNGVLGMTTWGFVSTLIPTMLIKGLPMPTALLMMTVASAIGAVGSYFWGFMDQKFGVQRAATYLSIWLIVAIAFLFVPGQAGAWIYVILFAMTIGGTNNYPPSMTAQVFGRDGASVAYPMVHIIKTAIMFVVYTILGQSLRLSGNYNYGWIVIIVLIIIAIIVFYNTNFYPKKDPIDSKATEE